MSLSFDAESTVVTPASNVSWTHTPSTGGALAAIAVLAVTDGNGGNNYTTCTYGGANILPVVGLVGSSTEVGNAALFFLSGQMAGVGAKTVALNTSVGAVQKAWAISFTSDAGYQAKVAASGVINGTSADPTHTLTTISSFSGFVIAMLASGQDDPASLTAGSGYTALSGPYDGAAYSGKGEYGSKSGASVVANFTSTAAGWGLAAMAIDEVIPVTTPRYEDYRYFPRDLLRRG